MHPAELLRKSRRLAIAASSPRVAVRIGIDVLLVAVFAAGAAGIFALAERWHAPMQPTVEIDLRPQALPVYTLLSLSRGFAAYLLSLAFTLVYGTVAAHNKTAEKVLIPLLDIGQGIPVLGFLPGLVLAMVALFPRTNVGLELACILMIFTGQVWNLTFSYFGSLRAIPAELREVARIHRFGWWRSFTTVELSSSVIGLVWNSMMSMAGGWFFLTVNEAFTLGDRDFRLPGIGSYMAVAIERNDGRAVAWAVFAMVAMIVAVDQLLWRPLVAFSQRFRLEDIGTSDVQTSWVYDLVRRSRLLRRLWRKPSRMASLGPVPAPPAPEPVQPSRGPSIGLALVGGAALVLAAFGVAKVVHLLLRLPLAQWGVVAAALGATAVRTAGALLLASLWTVPIGILIGRSERWSRRLQPVIQIVASFPAPMIFPLVTGLLLALGLPFSVIAAVLMLIGAQWYVLFNVLAGASAIPHDLDEASAIYSVRGLSRWRTLDLPAIFPFLVTGLITAAGGAWNASIVAEILVYRGRPLETFGLGSLITKATRDANFPLLSAGILTMSLALVLLNRTVWRKLYSLAETRFSMNR